VNRRYHHEARAELTAAAEWYEARRTGLGQDFVAEVDRALLVIQDNPETWPRWPGVKARVPVRKFVLQRFPFAIPYLVHDETIIVLAVAHGRRRPGYWLSRLRDVDVP
jgi:toxin ParE1/3/4